MLIARIAGLLRFLIGILLLQGATVLLTYTALMTDLDQTVWLFAALGGLLGILVALWFDSVIGSVREQAMAKQHKRHAREREKLRLEAERERSKLEARKKRDMGGARLRTGVAVGGMVGVGVAMMLAQFVTMGLLTVATAGGAALGYGVRARQEKRIRAREIDSGRLIVSQGADLPALEHGPPAKGSRRRRGKTDPA
jgi:hypothetical protein